MNLLQQLTLQKFVPKEILASLGFKSMLDVKLGNLKKKKFVIVSVLIAQNADMSLLNTFSEQALAIVQTSDGFIERYWEHGVVICFSTVKQATTAVKALLMMNSSLNIGITCDIVSICTLGDEYRIQPQILTSYCTFHLR